MLSDCKKKEIPQTDWYRDPNESDFILQHHSVVDVSVSRTLRKNASEAVIADARKLLKKQRTTRKL